MCRGLRTRPPLLEEALPAVDSHTLVRTVDDLLAPLYDACKPRAKFAVGTEAEKIGINEHGATAVAYEGPRGVGAILQQLSERYGWVPDREYPGGPLIALKRGRASITLEPGGQLELSGAPLATIHDTQAEFASHMKELRAVCDPMGIAWLGIGFHPLARQDQLPWVPKSRYATMRDYLPSRGARALDMMRRTCTVQANLDYESEADACRKLRLALAVQPIATAMFANSPFIEGRRGALLSERAAVWLEMDPDRCGLLPFAWSPTARFLDYVEWALDIPMFVIKRGDHVTPNTRQTFREFIREGLGDLRATATDWETHLNTLFPEVRLKRVIEVRGADSQRGDLICALPALWKGLLYDDQALNALEALTDGFQHNDLAAIRPQAAEHGLHAVLYDKPLTEWATAIVEIAAASLERQDARNGVGATETVYLRRLTELVRTGRSPANDLLAEIPAGVDIATGVLAHARA